ncbi:MAG: DUF1178 family protein [Sedimentitalea sp.]|nr:DUF1178 family protein [Sedimentitalea sp.]
MIQYALKCAEGHRFDSWFQSAEAFDKLVDSELLSCAVCGIVHVEKAVMAPRVLAGRDEGTEGVRVPAPRPHGPLSAPASPAEQALAEMRRKIEASADYVGRGFAAEARAIHDGDAPDRPIYGETRPDEARQLIEDGLPVTPLPFLPTRRSN